MEFNEVKFNELQIDNVWFSRIRNLEFQHEFQGPPFILIYSFYELVQIYLIELISLYGGMEHEMIY